MNSGGSKNVSLKYERYASPGCWDIGIIKLGFVAKTQFLYIKLCQRYRKLTYIQYSIWIKVLDRSYSENTEQIWKLV